MLRRQLVWAGLGLIVMVGATMVSYRLFCRWSYALFFVTLGLLVAVYFFPPLNNARRWIHIGPFTFQPSELAKVVYVLALARYLMYRSDHRRLLGLLVPLGLTLVPVFLVLREPDLGTAMVFLPVFLAVVFAAGARWRDFLVLVLAGMLAMPVLWTQMSREQRSRVTSVLHQTGPTDAPRDDTFQLHRAKQMLALGGTWGSWWTGPTVEDPAAYRLPEARSDFIFCVLGERFGLPGLAVVLLLYVVIVWRGAIIASATREPFGRLLATGAMALVAVEVVINTAMTVGLLPTTGLSLPLVSHGGSGLVAHAMLLGLVLNVGLRPSYEVADEPFRYAVERRGPGRA